MFEKEASYLQVFHESSLKNNFGFVYHMDIHFYYISLLLQGTFDERIGKGSTPILWKRCFRTNNCLLKPRYHLTPDERTWIFLFSFLLFFIIRCSLACNFTCSHYYLIRIKRFVLVGSKISMGKGIKKENIWKEFVTKSTIRIQK